MIFRLVRTWVVYFFSSPANYHLSHLSFKHFVLTSFKCMLNVCSFIFKAIGMDKSDSCVVQLMKKIYFLSSKFPCDLVVNYFRMRYITPIVLLFKARLCKSLYNDNFFIWLFDNNGNGAMRCGMMVWCDIWTCTERFMSWQINCLRKESL